MISADTVHAGLRLFLLFVADTSFILGSKPPHQANPSEIQRDKQLVLGYAISRLPLIVGPLIYGLTITQLYLTRYSYDGGWEAVEVLGALGMIGGGLLRLWCCRVLGRFFTFNVSMNEHLIQYVNDMTDNVVGYQKGQYRYYQA